VKVLDLFSGIGGFSLGLERTGGFETVAFCEIDPYCQKVLKKHWPEVPIYEDVREVTAARLVRDGIGADVITGGFPCQDISVAGKQAGISGERSGLWSELARIISEVRPRYAILENVTALIGGDRGRWFGRVLGDLAEIGYDAEWHCIPASALGAHHHRDRVWVIAYPNSNGLERFNNCRNNEQTSGTVFKGGEVARASDAHRAGIWRAEPGVDRVADGVPRRVDRLKGLGNAVVPQIPELIGHAIISYEKSRQRRHPAD
jgi:DNA (cytosine-5)-methyltransferase 1